MQFLRFQQLLRFLHFQYFLHFLGAAKRLPCSTYHNAVMESQHCVRSIFSRRCRVASQHNTGDSNLTPAAGGRSRIGVSNTHSAVVILCDDTPRQWGHRMRVCVAFGVPDLRPTLGMATIEERRLALAAKPIMGAPASARAAAYPFTCDWCENKQAQGVIQVGVHHEGGRNGNPRHWHRRPYPHGLRCDNHCPCGADSAPVWVRRAALMST